MTTIQAILLGIVEGLTEFLPVSSTGHLSIASHFLQIAQTDQVVLFEIAIQLGAILAVVFIYWKKLFDIKLLMKLFVAFLPTGLAGVLIYKFIKAMLDNEIIIALSLILGGIVLIVVEKIYQARYVQQKIQHEEIDYKKAFILGVCQCVSMIPGVSRSGAVMTAGLILNIKRNVLVEFTFLLAVPTMFAATLYSLYKSRDILSAEYLQTLGIGFIVSFIVAFIVVKAFLDYVRKFDFIPFGIYRIIFGLFILITLFS
jgi:undecaprenyl-diphosphatase